MRKLLLFTSIITIFNISFGQSGVLKGYVKDATSNEEIPFANVFVEQLSSGVATDFDGFFEFKDLKPGLYTINCSFVGYESKTFAEIRVGLKEGTMENGIFSDNKDEAEKMAAELVMFMRKNKDVKVGDDASQGYVDGITKFIYDDELLNALDPESGDTGEDCNSIVAARLKKLGVRIH